MIVRTIYVVVADKKTGERVRGVRLARLADAVRAGMPHGWATYRGGEYVRAGTRFLSTETPHQATPVIKIRGNDRIRNAALVLIARQARVESVAGYDRQLIGGVR